MNDYIQPILETDDFYLIVAPLREALGLPGGGYRTEFTSGEIEEIVDALEANGQTYIDLYYAASVDEWSVGENTGTDISSVWVIRIAPTGNIWTIQWATRRMVIHSETTKFWNTNEAQRVINFDTLASLNDTVVVLKANTNAASDGLLEGNRNFNVLSKELLENNTGNIPNEHRLRVVPEDLNGDGLPDNLLQDGLIDAIITDTWENLTANTTTGEYGIGYDGGLGKYYINLSAFSKSLNNSTTKGLDNDIIVTVNTGTTIERLSYDNHRLQNIGSQSNQALITRVYMEYSSSYHPDLTDIISITLKGYVYFVRDDELDPWRPVDDTDAIRIAYMTDSSDVVLHDRRPGRYPLNFAWFHHTPRLNLIDPASSNIIDVFIITKGYYTSMLRWLEGKVDDEPIEPTPLELRSSYSSLLDNKMISDTVVLHAGRFRVIFGSKAIPQLQVKFKVIRPERTTMTDNQVKTRIVSIIRSFFDINSWEFGETFFFTELAASIHAELGPEIDSIVPVPLYSSLIFGDLFQIQATEDELFLPDISTTDIEIVQLYTSDNIKQGKTGIL